jgi:peptide/nickel transport system permease protein
VTASAAEAATVSDDPPGAATRPRRRALPFRGDWISRTAAIMLLVLVIVSVFGPLLPLGSTTEIGVGPRLASPSWNFPFGTDALGRPMLPRVVEALRNTFALAVIAVAVTSVLATLIALVAGYKRGTLDALVSRTTDFMFAFPGLLLAVLVVTVIGPGDLAIVLSIVLFTSPLMVRVVRGATIAVAQRDFVRGAEVSGASTARILAVHLLPNVAGAVTVQATFALSGAMLIESGLSFLGLGVLPPAASLGSLVHDGYESLAIDPWLTLIPGLVLAITILSVNLLGDGIRDRLQTRKSRTL